MGNSLGCRHPWMRLQKSIATLPYQQSWQWNCRKAFSTWSFVSVPDTFFKSFLIPQDMNRGNSPLALGNSLPLVVAIWQFAVTKKMWTTALPILSSGRCQNASAKILREVQLELLNKTTAKGGSVTFKENGRP